MVRGSDSDGGSTQGISDLRCCANTVTEVRG